jgi:hypothetical protein
MRSGRRLVRRVDGIVESGSLQGVSQSARAFTHCACVLRGMSRHETVRGLAQLDPVVLLDC